MLLRRFTITLPAGLFLLNENQKLHYRVRSGHVKALRSAAMEQCSEDAAMRAALAEANPGPVLEHAYILGVVHLGTRRLFDPANFYPSFKATIDGLVDAGVLEDDNHTRLIGPDMRMGPVAKGGQLALHIQELTPEQHAAFVWQEAAAS
ncbi:hypothetical protein [Streptomyces sp. NPDC056227]|uniref:hypothetical protein n=1 Tax=Streptomyces sp. NPDC056227 TaxID=3345753 RepID=UPI0035E150FC